MKKNAFITSLILLPFLVGCNGSGGNAYPFEKVDKEVEFYEKFDQEVTHDRFLKQYSQWLEDLTTVNRPKQNHFYSYQLTQEYAYRSGSKEEWTIKETESRKDYVLNAIDERFRTDYTDLSHSEQNLNGVTGKNHSLTSISRYGEVYRDNGNFGYYFAIIDTKEKTNYVTETAYSDMKEKFLTFANEIQPYVYVTLAMEISSLEPKTFIDGTHLTFNLEQESAEAIDKVTHKFTSSGIVRGQFDIYDDKYQYTYIMEVNMELEVTEDSAIDVYPVTQSTNKFYAKKGDKIEQKYLVIKEIVLEQDNSLSVDKVDISDYKEVNI